MKGMQTTTHKVIIHTQGMVIQELKADRKEDKQVTVADIAAVFIVVENLRKPNEIPASIFPIL